MQVLVHTRRYNTPLAEFGIDKPFALDRGELVLEQLAKEFPKHCTAVDPRPISLADAALVHTEDYLRSLKQDEVWKEIFELKPGEYFPERATRPLHELIDDILLKSGGTLRACEIALEYGLAANLGGGYHHAFPDHGSGFCVLNDIAIAIRVMQKRRLCKNVMIVDVDFHQGDGTAAAFAGDSSVFTLSIHSLEGWPDQKQVSDMDIEIASGETRTYLSRLKEGLRQALTRFQPDFVVYVAGSDPYELDVLPGTRFIKLSLDELKQRDYFVLDLFAERNVPLAMVYAGGYGPEVWKVHYWATRRLLQKHLQAQGLLTADLA